MHKRSARLAVKLYLYTSDSPFMSCLECAYFTGKYLLCQKFIHKPLSSTQISQIYRVKISFCPHTNYSPHVSPCQSTFHPSHKLQPSCFPVSKYLSALTQTTALMFHRVKVPFTPHTAKALTFSCSKYLSPFMQANNK